MSKSPLLDFGDYWLLSFVDCETIICHLIATCQAYFVVFVAFCCCFFSQGMVK
nr:MAG TPA: hypothetical protein [Caudoviricetes sp.]